MGNTVPISKVKPTANACNPNGYIKSMKATTVKDKTGTQVYRLCYTCNDDKTWCDGSQIARADDVATTTPDKYGNTVLAVSNDSGIGTSIMACENGITDFSLDLYAESPINYAKCADTPEVMIKRDPSKPFYHCDYAGPLMSGIDVDRSLPDGLSYDKYVKPVCNGPVNRYAKSTQSTNLGTIGGNIGGNIGNNLGNNMAVSTNTNNMFSGMSTEYLLILFVFIILVAIGVYKYKKSNSQTNQQPSMQQQMPSSYQQPMQQQPMPSSYQQPMQQQPMQQQSMQQPNQMLAYQGPY